VRSNDAAHGDHFGVGLELRGGQFVAGAPNDDDQGPSSGSAYIFTFAGKDTNGDGLCDYFSGPLGDSELTDPAEVLPFGFPAKNPHEPEDLDTADGVVPDASPCPGDLNHDGYTDQADLGLLIAGWGCTSDCAGDCDNDGDATCPQTVY